MIRVLLIDNDKELDNNIIKTFEKDSEIKIVANITSTKEAIKYINNNIDIMLLNYIMPDNDGYYILKYLKENYINKRVIIISDILLNGFNNIFKSYNVDYFLLKPFDLDNLKNIILDLYIGNNNDLMSRVTKLLSNLGMPTSLIAFKYIRLAIISGYENNISLLNDLYIQISKEYNKSIKSIEKSIRNAIFISFDRADYDLIVLIFGNSVNVNTGVPTNSEYIFTIIDKMRLGII